MRQLLALFTIIAAACCAQSISPELCRKRPDAKTRWVSFENTSGGKGQGGKENRGAKGHAFDVVGAGKTQTLMSLKGSGMIRRLWVTVNERNPVMLRSLRLDIYWDDASKPAVSVPFGDFFGAILGRAVPFESELFTNPEGRSFNCYIPMPFRKAARVTVTNESERDLKNLFYDIDVVLTEQPDPEALYFHACWRRERWTTLGSDFEVLPKIHGEGRFLGANIGVIVKPGNIGWWGEGEVKMYLDGDGDLPTLVGTGTEDYIGTGWGQGVFHNRYQGSLIVDGKAGQYGFYRYHVPDPVYFHRDVRVTIQQMGGAPKSEVLAALEKGVSLQPVTVAQGSRFLNLLESPRLNLKSTGEPAAWTNFYRQDDVSAVALFYLDAPTSELPPLAGVAQRIQALPAR